MASSYSVIEIQSLIKVSGVVVSIVILVWKIVRAQLYQTLRREEQFLYREELFSGAETLPSNVLQNKYKRADGVVPPSPQMQRIIKHSNAVNLMDDFTRGARFLTPCGDWFQERKRFIGSPKGWIWIHLALLFVMLLFTSYIVVGVWSDEDAGAIVRFVGSAYAIVPVLFTVYVGREYDGILAAGRVVRAEPDANKS